MILISEDISQFKKIYQEAFGIELSDDEAQVQAQACLLLAKMELEPIDEVNNVK